MMRMIWVVMVCSAGAANAATVEAPLALDTSRSDGDPVRSTETDHVSPKRYLWPDVVDQGPLAFAVSMMADPPYQFIEDGSEMRLTSLDE